MVNLLSHAPHPQTTRIQREINIEIGITLGCVHGISWLHLQINNWSTHYVTGSSWIVDTSSIVGSRHMLEPVLVHPQSWQFLPVLQRHQVTKWH